MNIIAIAAILRILFLLASLACKASDKNGLAGMVIISDWTSETSARIISG
jgi:hypothetical protein